MTATSSRLNSRGWELDADGGIILLKVPNTLLCLSPTRPPVPLSRSFNDLPYEIHAQIIDYLAPIDRVCTALACRSLLNLVSTLPRLTAPAWSRYEPRQLNIHQHLPALPSLPEWYPLLPRLAHGWLSKSKWRYCWKCHRILPRTPAYFQRPGKMSRKRTPKYNIKVGMPRDQWESLGKQSRYDHLIKTWCTSTNEDSSVMFCDTCRPGDKVQAKSISEVPVECPICLERELTFTWIRPRGSSKAAKWCGALFGGTWFLFRLAVLLGRELGLMTYQSVVRGGRRIFSR